MNIINSKFCISFKNLFFEIILIILKNSINENVPKTINIYNKKKLNFTVRNTIDNKAKDV